MNYNSIEQRAHEMRAAGKPIRKIAADLGISKSKVERILNSSDEPRTEALSRTRQNYFETQSDETENIYGTVSQTQKDKFSNSTLTNSDMLNNPKPEIFNKIPSKPIKLPQIMILTSIFHEESLDFIHDNIEGRKGNFEWEIKEFIRFSRKGNRLIKFLEILCAQINHNPESLLIYKVLKDIKESSFAEITEAEQDGIEYLPEAYHEKVEYWSTVLSTSLFHPITE